MLTRPAISSGNSECIWRTSLSSLVFHSSFMSLTLSVLRIFSSFCQAVRWTLPPSVSQSAPQLKTQPAARATTTGDFRIPIPIPLYLEQSRKQNAP